MSFLLSQLPFVLLKCLVGILNKLFTDNWNKKMEPGNDSFRQVSDPVTQILGTILSAPFNKIKIKPWLNHLTMPEYFNINSNFKRQINFALEYF